MSKKKATAISLPISRTQKIMISAVGVESVNSDIVALATKATEIFLMDFAQRAYDQSSDEEFRSNVLEYDDIHKLVHSDSRYDFLQDTTPKRIKFSEALKLVEEANRKKESAEAEAEAEAEAGAQSLATASAATKMSTSDLSDITTTPTKTKTASTMTDEYDDDQNKKDAYSYEE